MELCDFFIAAAVALVEAFSFAAVEFDLAFDSLDLAAQCVEGFCAAIDALFRLGQRNALLFGVEFSFTDLRFEGSDFVTQHSEFSEGFFNDGEHFFALIRRDRKVEHLLGFTQALEACGLASLSLEGRDLSLDLSEHVVHSV